MTNLRDVTANIAVKITTAYEKIVFRAVSAGRRAAGDRDKKKSRQAVCRGARRRRNSRETAPEIDEERKRDGKSGERESERKGEGETVAACRQREDTLP